MNEWVSVVSTLGLLWMGADALFRRLLLQTHTALVNETR